MLNCLILPFLVFFGYFTYLICTPDRVRFTRYTEWSLSNDDGSDRGVVVIDPEMKDSPDYHAPDKVRHYPRERNEPMPGWVKRLAWASVVLAIIVMSYSVS